MISLARLDIITVTTFAKGHAVVLVDFVSFADRLGFLGTQLFTVLFFVDAEAISEILYFITPGSAFIEIGFAITAADGFVGSG